MDVSLARLTLGLTACLLFALVQSLPKRVVAEEADLGGLPPAAVNEWGPALDNCINIYDHDLSISGCTKVLEFLNKPEHHELRAEIYDLRGRSYTLKKNYVLAMQDYNEAIRLNPNYAIAYKDRGYFYWQIGDDLAKAFEDLSKAVELDPKYAVAIEFRACMLVQALRSGVSDAPIGYDLLIQDLTISIGLNPSRAEAYACRGEAYEKSGHNRLAREDFIRAHKIDPSNIFLKQTLKYLRLD